MKHILFFCTLFSTSAFFAQVDLALIDIYPVDYLSTGSTKKFYPVCHNMGSANVNYSDMIVQWQIDGGPVSTSIPQNTTPSFLIAGLKKPLESSTMNLQAPATAGVYILKVWVTTTAATDAVPSNDTITRTIKVIDDLPEKNVVLKMFKHQSCGPCYPADTMIKNQVDILPQYNTVNIYTSTSDVIYSAHGDTLDNYAHPTVVFDYFDFPSDPFSLGNGFYTLNGEKYLENLYVREEFLEPVSVDFASVDVDVTNRIITAELSALFYDDITDDLRFNIYVLEDSILAYQTSAPDPNNYYHTRVLRTMLGGTWGQPSSIPASVSAGQSVNYTFSYNVPAGYNIEKLRLVGIVQRYNASVYNRRMLNSKKVFVKDYSSAASVNNLESSEKFSIYPNPAATSLNVVLPEGLDVNQIQVMNLVGGVELELEYTDAIDISQLAAGSYYIVISNETNSYSQLFVKK